jgi:hypothetical protein
LLPDLDFAGWRAVVTADIGSDLGADGRKLWERMHAALADDLEFSPHELEVLLRACRSTDREADLRLALACDGVMSVGSCRRSGYFPI